MTIINYSFSFQFSGLFAFDQQCRETNLAVNPSWGGELRYYCVSPNKGEDYTSMAEGRLEFFSDIMDLHILVQMYTIVQMYKMNNCNC